MATDRMWRLRMTSMRSGSPFSMYSSLDGDRQCVFVGKLMTGATVTAPSRRALQGRDTTRRYVALLSVASWPAAFVTANEIFRRMFP